MVRIRLRRVGAKKQPHYRVVVADQRSPRDGRHIETIGYYNPRTEPETVNIKEDRALYWLSQGAQPSEVVQRMLEKQGTLARLNRLKAGEPLEALLAEYETEVAAEEPPEPVEAEPTEEEVSAAEALEEEADVEVPEAEIAAEKAEVEAPEAETPVEESEVEAPEAEIEAADSEAEPEEVEAPSEAETESPEAELEEAEAVAETDEEATDED